MTTTLLMMTLMFGQTGNVGLDSEAAARRLVGADAAASQVSVQPSLQTTRLRLLEERSDLVAQMPEIAGPMVMLVFSPLAGTLAGFLWAGFAALDGFRAGWGLLLSIPAFVLAVILTGGTVALSTIGTILLAKRLRDINIAETRIGEIDEQLRTGWPTARAPVPLGR